MTTDQLIVTIDQVIVTTDQVIVITDVVIAMDRAPPRGRPIEAAKEAITTAG